ncbi:MAG TPA: hypothetical protein VNJ04_19605 [Gemmatimonadaceae bacterium]|nr:hypothetical protein [Gemmatimonadaceae bacterium]
MHATQQQRDAALIEEVADYLYTLTSRLNDGLYADLTEALKHEWREAARYIIGRVAEMARS